MIKKWLLALATMVGLHQPEDMTLQRVEKLSTRAQGKRQTANSAKRWPKPSTKCTFKQNQRKQRQSSARKKAKRV